MLKTQKNVKMKQNSCYSVENETFRPKYHPHKDLFCLQKNHLAQFGIPNNKTNKYYQIFFQ